MTQSVKEQILYTWKLVGKLHQVLDKQINNYIGKVSEEFLQLLEQYQNAVIAVGETIEQCTKEEERQNIITLLEGFCEEIYQLSQSTGSIPEYRRQSTKLQKKYQDILKILKKFSVPWNLYILQFKKILIGMRC